MDTLTHALSGALLARATAPSSPNTGTLSLRERSLVGSLAAVFPDIDNIIRFAYPLTFLNVHQGVTHSLLLVPLWAVMLSFLFAWVLTRAKRREYRWRMCFGVCTLGLIAHIAGDVITAYGTRIFAPFSDQKVSLFTTFVIDPIFSGIIVVALMVSGWKPRAAAGVGLMVLIGYVGFQALLRQEARALGVAYVEVKQLAGATVHALPQPLSPFNWMVVVNQGDSLHEALVNLKAPRRHSNEPRPSLLLGRIAASYRPAEKMRWTEHHRFGNDMETERLAREVWYQAGFSEFRRFALLPILYRVDRSPDKTCVWFTDLRFMLRELVPPFRFGMCRDFAASPWRLYQLRGSHPGKAKAIGYANLFIGNPFDRCVTVR